ncbi:type IV pilin protein [Luteimonas pelagia]
MRKSSGFTLIELMVVVVIIAIIAAIALPGYREQVRKSRRADASRAVGQLQLDLERWRAENPSYANCAPTPCGSGTYPNVDSYDSAFYNLSLPTATPSTFVITAAPIGAQAGDRCGTLTLNENSKGKPSWATASCN